MKPLDRLLRAMDDLGPLGRTALETPFGLAMLAALLLTALAGLADVANTNQEAYNQEVLASTLGDFSYRTFPTSESAQEITFGRNVSPSARDNYQTISHLRDTGQWMIKGGALREDITPFWRLGDLATLYNQEDLILSVLGPTPPTRETIIDLGAKGASSRSLSQFLWYLNRYIYPKIEMLIHEQRFYEARRWSRLAAAALGHFYYPPSGYDHETTRRISAIYTIDALLSVPMTSYRNAPAVSSYIEKIREAFCTGDCPAADSNNDAEDQSQHNKPCRIGKSFPVIDLALQFRSCKSHIAEIAAIKTESAEQADLLALLYVRALFWRIWACERTHQCIDEISQFQTALEAANRRTWIFPNLTRDLTFYSQEVARQWH